MGTTLVASLFYDNRVLVAHIGDSRCIVCATAACEQVTRDHSLLQEQIDSGPDHRRAGANVRRTRTSSRGRSASSRASSPRSTNIRREPGDIYLLCSDGLSDMVEDDEIGMTLQALGGNLKLAAQQLVQMANDNGGRDNVSVILVRVLREYPGARGGNSQAVRVVKITTSPGERYGEADPQHGWTGAQGDPLGQGAHHHRPQAA